MLNNGFKPLSSYVVIIRGKRKNKSFFDFNAKVQISFRLTLQKLAKKLFAPTFYCFPLFCPNEIEGNPGTINKHGTALGFKVNVIEGEHLIH